MYRLYISVLVFALSFSVYSCKNDKTKQEYIQLYNDNFIADEIKITRKSTEPTSLLQAHEAYNLGHYGLASPVFLSYEATLEPPSRLAYAITLIKTNQEAAAISQLKKIESIPMFNNAGFWYQGLIALRNNDIESVKTHFAKIEEGSRYKPKALKILSQIK